MARSKVFAILRNIDSLLEQAEHWHSKSKSSFFASVTWDEEVVDPKVARQKFESSIGETLGLAASCLDYFDEQGIDTRRIRKGVVSALDQGFQPSEIIAYLRVLSGRIKGMALTED